jgi:carbon-monoxide dehydrogenase large subunit
MSKMQATLTGQPVRRVEDARFLTGQGTFTDDLRGPEDVTLRVVRADVPHAQLHRIDTAAAAAMPGVLAVFTASDLRASGIAEIASLNRGEPFGFLDRFGEPLPDGSQYALAEDKIRYVGEALACVVAENDAVARDAAEAVVIEYEPLAPVMYYDQALAPAPETVIWDDVGSNVSFEWDLGDESHVERLFADAGRVVKSDVVNNRVVIAFMEPRAARAELLGGRLVLTAGSQGAPGLQQALLGIFGGEMQLRVVTPDTGGGFGARGGVYPEYVHLLYATQLLGRPVAWAEDRSEAFLTDMQSRDHLLRTQLAFAQDGALAGLRVEADWRHGAYVPARTFTVMTQYLPPTLGGVYRVNDLHLRLRGVFSNTTPQAAYRGIGRVEATYLIEDAMDVAARELGIDRIELRRRNLVSADEMPRRAAGGAEYHSGEFADNLNRALTIADWYGFEARREQSETAGKLRGIGLAMFIENDGGNPIEFASLSASADGRFELLAGTQDFGMGHQTVFAQVLADRLGVPMDAIRVLEGDTDIIPRGSGTHGSRSARIGGGAVVAAVELWKARGRELASLMLQAAEEDISYDPTRAAFLVRDTERVVAVAALAEFAAQRDEALRADAEFQVERPAHSNGVQVCELEIDPQTGGIELINHVLVLDAGVILNPMIVEGQMHGGLAQGLGQAWLERVVYDGDSGQTLSGSFMDYAIPRADDLPTFDTATNEVREVDNPLGVKGAGEGPTTGAPAAFMNAVNHAVVDAGGARVAMPATSERVWRALDGQQFGPDA